MGWDTTRPGTNPKYRTPEHRREVARLKAQLQREGYLICTADVCLFDTRTITNANGMDRDGLHAGHEDDGINYRGPQHRACNLRDGAVRASARSHAHSPTRWVF